MTLTDKIRTTLSRTAERYGCYPFSDEAIRAETGVTRAQLTRCLAALAARDEWRSVKGYVLRADPSLDGRPLRRYGVLVRGGGIAPAPTFTVRAEQQ